MDSVGVGVGVEVPLERAGESVAQQEPSGIAPPVRKTHRTPNRVNPALHRPVAVVLSTDDLEAIEETVAILSDPAAMRQIEQGLADVDAGEVADRDELEALRSQLHNMTE